MYIGIFLRSQDIQGNRRTYKITSWNTRVRDKEQESIKKYNVFKRQNCQRNEKGHCDCHYRWSIRSYNNKFLEVYWKPWNWYQSCECSEIRSVKNSQNNNKGTILLRTQAGKDIAARSLTCVWLLSQIKPEIPKSQPCERQYWVQGCNKKTFLMRLNMKNCILLVLLLLVSMVLVKCTKSPLMIHFLNFIWLFHL